MDFLLHEFVSWLLSLIACCCRGLFVDLFWVVDLRFGFGGSLRLVCVCLDLNLLETTLFVYITSYLVFRRCVCMFC